MDEQYNFKIMSINIRGLNDRKKRRKVFRWIKNNKIDICFVQETHSTADLERIWRSEWGRDIIYSHGTNRARGVAILMKPGLDMTVNNVYSDNIGRMLLADVTIQNTKFKLLNIYAPNTEDSQLNFFHYVRNVMARKVDAEDKIMIGGDWNLIIDPAKDRKGGAGIRETEKRKLVLSEVNKIKESFQVTDIWRVRNPQARRFTWRRVNPSVTSRLDYWLTSKAIEDHVEEADIVPSINSDHSAVTLNMKNVQGRVKGRGIWRLNNSFLNEEPYVKELIQQKEKWLDEFNDVNDARLKWELIKYRIRQVSIHYGKQKAKRMRTKEEELEAQLKKLETEQDGLANTDSEETNRKINLVKSALEEIAEYKTKGLILRSQARWFEKGEKSTKYFLQMESRNKIKKTATKLQKDDGSYTTDGKEILQMQAQFYQTLYSRKDFKSHDEVQAYVRTVNMPELSTEDSKSCEGQLSVDECKAALKEFKSNKSPGNDGITAEFYKKFWPMFGPLMVAAFNESYIKGELSTSQRQAVITLLDKGKDRCLLKNWRPISLLNVDYKIIAKAIANRFTKYLPNLINNNQAGYVKDRNILDNVRTVVDILEYLKEKQLPGILINVDFEKAFDSLSWTFLQTVLQKFNFGESFRKWIELLYTNISSCISNNGFTSRYFNVERGVRQGDPLSPYLFILAVEVMACKIKQDEAIEGIAINGQIVKLLQYADDTNGILRNQKSAKHFLKTIKTFGEFSGLCLNATKTEGLWLGSNAASNSKPLNILWPDRPIRILGIYVSYDKEACHKCNFESRLEKAKQIINLWSMRNLTMYGRAQILKTYIISQSMYVCSVIHTPKTFIKEISKLIFKFVWKNRRERLQRTVLISEYEYGGLRIPDFETMLNSVRLKWIKKLVKNDNQLWKSILNMYLSELNVDINTLLYSNFSMRSLNIKKRSIPQFYYEIIDLWSGIGNTTNIDKSNFMWYNKDICVNNKLFLYEEFFRAGLWYISDLYKHEGDPVSFNEWVSRGVSKMNIIKWWGMLAKTKNLRALHSVEITDVPRQLCLSNATDTPLETMSSKDIYRTLLKWKTGKSTYPPKIAKYIDNIEAEQWTKAYTRANKIPVDTKTKEFQYRFLHDLLANRYWLYKWKIKDTPKCLYCKTEDENITHMFWLCKDIKPFWERFSELCKQHLQPVAMNMNTVCFGVDNLIICSLIFAAKMFIYGKKLAEQEINFTGFKQYVHYLKCIEFEIAKQNNTTENCVEKWSFLEL